MSSTADLDRKPRSNSYTNILSQKMEKPEIQNFQSTINQPYTLLGFAKLK